MTLKTNTNTFSGANIFVVFAKASIHLNCKIQTMCVETNIRVSFTPPEVMEEDYVKILYKRLDKEQPKRNQRFTVCQRVVEIRMNEGDKDSSQQKGPDFSEVCIQKNGSYVSRDYFVVYGYDYSQDVYEVEIHTSLPLLQKFERFLEKIPHESSIAFIYQKAPLFPLFVKAFLRHLGRKPPIDAGNDPYSARTWLSNNETRRDLSTHQFDVKSEFIINLSFQSRKFQETLARNATSRYTHIYLPIPSSDELEAITFLSSEKNEQSDEAYPMHANNMEKYLSRTDF